MPNLSDFKKFIKFDQKDEKVVVWIKPDDTLLQSNLDIAKKNILTKLGGPAELPDDPAIDRCCYLLAQFYTQNRSTQETKAFFDMDIFKRERTEYYRERVFHAVSREIDNLVLPFKDVSKFMPEVPA